MVLPLRRNTHFRILGNLTVILGHLRAILGHLGVILGHRGAILGHLGGVLGGSWASLGHLGATLGPSCDHLGPPWGPCWEVLGTRSGALAEAKRSFSHLQALFVHFGRAHATTISILSALPLSKLGQAYVK